MSAALGKGWAFITASRKWHYYDDDNRSLCRHFMVLKSTFELGNDDSPDNCATCRKRLFRLRSATPPTRQDGDQAETEGGER